jgi:hypothetical protein
MRRPRSIVSALPEPGRQCWRLTQSAVRLLAIGWGDRFVGMALALSIQRSNITGYRLIDLFHPCSEVQSQARGEHHGPEALEPSPRSAVHPCGPEPPVPRTLRPHREPSGPLVGGRRRYPDPQSKRSALASSPRGLSCSSARAPKERGKTHRGFAPKVARRNFHAN